MCKAAAVTKRIRMGAAVKLIHLAHPVDTAIQAAVTDHVVGGNRFIFGFGSGFPSPLFANERGLTHEDRHERLRESLDLILKCWTAQEPFDWDGKYWRGKGIVALPQPLHPPHMPMATATDTAAMIDIAGARGYAMLRAQLEPPGSIRESGRSLCARRQGRGPQRAAEQFHRGALRLSRRFAPRGHGRPARRHQLRARLSDEARADPADQVELRHRAQGRRGHLRPARRGRRLLSRRSGQRGESSCATSTRPPAASARC